MEKKKRENVYEKERKEKEKGRRGKNKIKGDEKR
jgi:hypothetical protein